MRKMVALRIDKTLLAQVAKFLAKTGGTRTALIEKGLKMAMAAGGKNARQ